MKVLSLREPWLYAMLELGKDIENRVWSTRYRGPLSLHRALGCTRAEYDWAEAWMQDNIDPEIVLPPFDVFMAGRRFGGIVALCTVTGCTLNSARNPRPKWAMLVNAEGRPQYGFDVSNIITHRFVPWVGAQRIFNVDDAAYDAAFAAEVAKDRTCEIVTVGGGAGLPNEEIVCGHDPRYVYGGTFVCEECGDELVTSGTAHPSELMTVEEYAAGEKKP